MIDNFQKAIIQPDRAFVFGCDYRVPILHGLLDKGFINDLKMSPSFNQTTFATEYLSIWQGASQQSWFNFDKMTKYRKIKNPQYKYRQFPNSNYFYLISWDVARLHDQSVVCVFRVNITSDLTYHSTLVNLIVLGLTDQTKQFSKQVIQVKKMIKAYKATQVVIDTNGLGIGVGDLMIQQQVDQNGIIYPPYAFNNDENYLKIQPNDAPKILYGIKANATLKSKIHSNTYARIAGGLVHFLIKQQEAKSALLATEVGQKMTVLQRVQRLMPHEMTTSLFDQMANLRLKRTGTSTDIVLEQINARFPDDKYMSFAYGLWRIKQLQQESSTRKRRYGSGKRKLVFYN